MPHIYTMPTGGHTPGHTVYVLESKGEKMYFWGDLVHMEGLQFVEPTLKITLMLITNRELRIVKNITMMPQKITI